MLERSLYLLRRALRNIRQSPVLCGAAIGTVAVALTILAFFGILVLNIQKLTSQWSQQVQVVAYLDQVPAPSVLESWKKSIAALPEVDRVVFVSRGTALERFRQRLGADASLLEGVEEDILPASLEIGLRPEARNRAGAEVVVAALRDRLGLADLRYGQDWLDRFEAFLTLLRTGFLVLGGFLLFAALFIVANTIKLTLYARKDELEVMALVGGTPWFIKTPFLLEGGIQGLCGGGLALAGAALVFHGFLQQGLSTLLLAAGVDGITFLPPIYQLFLVGLGVFLGVAGSLLSLRRLVRA
ncbi:permease-like cell division protein FtsX [Desulfuromonas carbonis]|uniref:permease-like cell division protein FtsX n=1 Tax=Desulfuromonas sp. DDH964 TaxID=1823759 RepID=UPI00078EEE19|nr:permease-like cell division protein FtsX [Desulfuromonas sp. DDH964]AMV72771.1 cell division ABC transporter membrane protein FtsX [Desulfuromonas sp. DDH964]